MEYDLFQRRRALDALAKSAWEQAKQALAALNERAPTALKVEWDAAWDDLRIDELYDLRDELKEMLAAPPSQK